jgi:sn-glycerol 3-phosphate transport system permease protein
VKESRFSSIMMQLICIVCAIMILAPILYAVSVSFMKPRDILTTEYHLIPPEATLENYVKALTTTPIMRYLFNSFVVALTSSVSRVVIGACAAFAFAFYEFKGKRFLFALTLSTIMVPPDGLGVQNFVTISKLGLVNTYIGICSIFLVSANNIFMMRQQFLSFSRSLYEASRIDGANDLTFFVRILLPTSKPILFTIFISSFVNVWNQYVWPMLVTNRTEMRTIQVGITMLKDRQSAVFGPVMAGATIALVPTIIVFILFLKRIVSGMMTGAIKE